MGIRITDSEHVAIYDSVSDWAFGPVFDNEEAAEEFLSWAVDNVQSDLRKLTPGELEYAYKKFIDEKQQDDSDSLEDLPV